MDLQQNLTTTSAASTPTSGKVIVRKCLQPTTSTISSNETRAPCHQRNCTLKGRAAGLQHSKGALVRFWSFAKAALTRTFSAWCDSTPRIYRLYSCAPRLKAASTARCLQTCSFCLTRAHARQRGMTSRPLQMFRKAIPPLIWLHPLRLAATIYPSCAAPQSFTEERQPKSLQIAQKSFTLFHGLDSPASRSGNAHVRPILEAHPESHLSEWSPSGGRNTVIHQIAVITYFLYLTPFDSAKMRGLKETVNVFAASW